MIRSYTMMKTGSTTGTVCHQGKRIKPDHGPTPEDHDPRKLPLAPGLPPPKGETDSEVLLLALDRVRGDLGEVCEVLATARGVTALAWVDRTRPGLVFLARGALCPMAVARDAHGHLYWASSPRWFRHLDEQAAGRLGFQVERVAEGTVLAIATDRAVPTVVAERSFTPTARAGDAQRFASIWAGLDPREAAAFQAAARHHIAPPSNVTRVPDQACRAWSGSKEERMTNQQTSAAATPERRVRVTASVDYTLSVPASCVEDPDSEYQARAAEPELRAKAGEGA